MRAVRYRTGTCARTGLFLRGWPHCAQSLGKIWQTRLGTRSMRLAFGSELRSHLGEDITPELALDIYTDLTVAAHTYEDEYRVQQMQLVALTREGVLGLSHSGIYYPEGRFGNYEDAEPVTAKVALRALRRSEVPA
jgi:phage baseplate assembly protein W